MHRLVIENISPNLFRLVMRETTYRGSSHRFSILANHLTRQEAVETYAMMKAVLPRDREFSILGIVGRVELGFK